LLSFEFSAQFDFIEHCIAAVNLKLKFCGGVAAQVKAKENKAKANPALAEANKVRCFRISCRYICCFTSWTHATGHDLWVNRLPQMPSGLAEPPLDPKKSSSRASCERFDDPLRILQPLHTHPRDRHDVSLDSRQSPECIHQLQ
jgi:hypothetical protein